MIIGIDLDNTIINYEDAFKKASQDIFQVPDLVFESAKGISHKDRIKSYLIDSTKVSQNAWERLQGQVYSSYIKEASIFVGVKNFLLRCSLEDIKVYIISHKTKFGHYDKKKIPLRLEAINFLDRNNFFNKFTGLTKQDVFFLKTRKEKIDKISELKVTHFIDDLKEIFEDASFPESIDKTLFKDSSQVDDEGLFISWFQIHEKFFGEISEVDINNYTSFLFKKKPLTTSSIKGRANSKLFEIHLEKKKKFAGKLYPDPIQDKRNRIITEKKAYDLLNSNKIQESPKLVSCSKDLNFTLIEWIEGEDVVTINQEDISQAYKFIKRIKKISDRTRFHDFSLASAACLCGLDIEKQIISRMEKFTSYLPSDHPVITFIQENLSPSFSNTLEHSKKNWPMDFSQKLEKEELVLSPSDFGFHNAIKTDKGIKFIDFEYFGWDDPVKLTCDFILHPGMELTKELRRYWIEGMKNLFSKDKLFHKRVQCSLGLYVICWCLIVLNNFLKYDKKNPSTEGAKTDENLLNYLSRSKDLLNYVNKNNLEEILYE